jgi:hypothetical protein
MEATFGSLANNQWMASVHTGSNTAILNGQRTVSLLSRSIGSPTLQLAECAPSPTLVFPTSNSQRAGKKSY